MIYRFYSNPIQGARVTVVGQLEGNSLNVACARCSPRDNFVRRKGRTIAEGRLKKGKLYGAMVIGYAEQYRPKLFIELATDVAEDVAKTKKPVTQ